MIVSSFVATAFGSRLAMATLLIVAFVPCIDCRASPPRSPYSLKDLHWSSWVSTS